jgi:hypothetical protein
LDGFALDFWQYKVMTIDVHWSAIVKPYLQISAAGLCLALLCIFAIPGQAGQVDMSDVVFKEVEKRLIREYYGSREKSHGKKRGNNKHGKKGKRGGVPPGLAKRDSLPPGLAKRKHLPPGLAKRDLPPGLLDILPAAPRGTKRVIVDNNVVLVQKATGIVLDILMDAVEGTK